MKIDSLFISVITTELVVFWEPFGVQLFKVLLSPLIGIEVCGFAKSTLPR